MANLTKIVLVNRNIDPKKIENCYEIIIIHNVNVIAVKEYYFKVNTSNWTFVDFSNAKIEKIHD